MLQAPTVVRVVNVGFPPGYVEQQISENGTITSPLIRCWLNQKMPVPVFFHEHGNQILRTAADWAWRDTLYKNGIRNLAAHGLIDVTGLAMTYFCFADTKMERQELDTLLRLIVPHLHIALTQEHLGNSSDSERLNLSIREKDVLKLVCHGKTNNEIAGILGISGWTVKIHVRNFMSKLEVTTRAQAVAKAMSFGFVG